MSKQGEEPRIAEGTTVKMQRPVDARSRTAAQKPAVPRVSRVGLMLAAALVPLLLLLLVAGAASGWFRGLFGPGTSARDTVPPLILQPAPTAAILMPGAVQASNAPQSDVPPLAAAGPPPTISPRFQPFYESNGGLDRFGLPISEPLTINGREIQWFERARMEHWPEFAGSPYEIQLGRLGAEYTQGRTFPEQAFFADRPDLRYFPETRHGLGGAFLSYWEQNGDVTIFGLPISDEFDEVLADGKPYRVQYFERVRLEYHPDRAGTPYVVQIGLLGRALYQSASALGPIPAPGSPVPQP